MAKVIGIMGLAGAGKDTVAAMLQRGLVSAGGQHVKLGKFAAYMYEIAGALFSHSSLTDRKKKESPHTFSADQVGMGLGMGIANALKSFMSKAEMIRLLEETVELLMPFANGAEGTLTFSPRQFLQYLGDAGKKVRPQLWVDLAMDDWKAFDGLVICTDARFPYEVEQLDQVIFVKRPGVKRVSPHNSEALSIAINDGLASVPGMEFIDNDGTLEDLENEVAAMAASFAPIFAGAF